MEEQLEQGTLGQRRRRTLKAPHARGEVVRCGSCGEVGHSTIRCQNTPFEDEERRANAAPLETPSGNGTYAGPAKVRVLPSGVFGSDLDSENPRPASAKSLSPARGRTKQKIEAALAREEKRKAALELERRREPIPPKGAKRKSSMVRVDRRCSRCRGTGHYASTCPKVGTEDARTDGRTDGRTGAQSKKGDAHDGVEEGHSKAGRGGRPVPRPSSSPSIAVGAAAVIRVRVKERKDGVDVHVSVEGE